MIARADRTTTRLHSHGSCPRQSCIVTFQIPAAGGHTIQYGDKLVWMQYQQGGVQGGVNIFFKDGSQIAWRANDSTGQNTIALSTQNQWVNRSVDLSGYAQQGSTPAEITSAFYLFTNNSTAPNSTWDLWVNDVAIVGLDGTVTPVYSKQPGGSLPVAYNWNNYGSNLTAVQETVDAGGNPQDTVYYQGDHLGSTRVSTSSGGWPTFSSTFYPFGQEAAITADPGHYKYASLERDGDSGLGPVTDHATFRQYSPTTGSWMSPDPYDGSYDLSNPQSLNRYAYVLNNPMAWNDPTGLTCSVVVGGITQSPNTSETSAQQQFASNIGAIQAFPYAGGSIPSGIASVQAQALYANTDATWVTAAALTQAAANGPFNIFTFSGGLQATISALRLVSPQVRSLVQNITSISPGLGIGGGAEGPASGNITFLTGTSVWDKLAQNAIIDGTNSGCGHDANCVFTKNSALLAKQAGSGSGCSTPTTYVPKGSPGGQQVSSPWSYPSLFFFGLFGGDGTSVTTTQTVVWPTDKTN